MNEVNLAAIAGGLVIGLFFGIIMQRSRFCMVAAVSNLILVRDYRYVQAFLAAWAISIVGVSLLEALNIVNIASSGYRSGSINWLGAIGGGVVFGFGATLAGGCAARTMVNAAEGSLAGLITLLAMMLFAGITTYGALEPVRIWLTQPTSVALASGDSSIASIIHTPAWLAGLAVAVGVLVLTFRLGSVSENRTLLVAGALLGLLVVAAWWTNGWLAIDEFSTAKPGAVAITGPLAKLNLVLASGSGSLWNFGVAFILSLFIGAMSSAILGGKFATNKLDASRIPQHLVGGALMGIGATFAGGCNIGQGLSGVSTLSLTSLLATASMFAGVWLGVKWWERRA
jgi:uncharacterized membrane protein YedE/YeeE